MEIFKSKQDNDQASAAKAARRAGGSMGVDMSSYVLREDYARLRDNLGSRLVSIATGLKEIRTIHDWAEGVSTPSKRQKEQLKILFDVTEVLKEAKSNASIIAWLQDRSPMLGDVSPATAICATWPIARWK